MSKGKPSCFRKVTFQGDYVNWFLWNDFLGLRISKVFLLFCWNRFPNCSITPPKLNSSPLTSSLPNRKGSSSNHHFAGANHETSGSVVFMVETEARRDAFIQRSFDAQERPNLQSQCEELQRSTGILQQDFSHIKQWDGCRFTYMNGWIFMAYVNVGKYTIIPCMLWVFFIDLLSAEVFLRSVVSGCKVATFQIWRWRNDTLMVLMPASTMSMVFFTLSITGWYTTKDLKSHMEVSHTKKNHMHRG